MGKIIIVLSIGVLLLAYGLYNGIVTAGKKAISNYNQSIEDILK